MATERVHADDREATNAAVCRAAEAHGEYIHEYRSLHPDGTVRCLSARGRYLYGEDGKPARMADAMLDIIDALEQQERQQALFGELQHRTRNLMSVVRSVADKTMRRAKSLDEFRVDFRTRLDALNRVQGLLSRLEEHERVSFDELLRAELAAHGVANGAGERVTLDGPEGVRLRSSMVQMLATGLHELATNAAKYGALRQPDGRLDVSWRLVDREADGEWLEITWREHDVTVPAAAALANSGGQSRELIERPPLPARRHHKLPAWTRWRIVRYHHTDLEDHDMTGFDLSGRAILVVEDEFVLADDLCTALARQGAKVIGPAATVVQGFSLLREAEELHAAVLDINLRGEEVFGLADELSARGVPFVLTTGYDASVIPHRYRDVPRCEKPVDMARLMDVIGRAAHA